MSHKNAKLERRINKAAEGIAHAIASSNRQHRLFYGSSYDRGLQHLLKMWPRIIERFPDALLDICYGWELFDKGYLDNPERMAWKDKMNEMMKQPGIIHHGRVSKNELQKIRQSCGIWAYPTHFGETNCITALDCQLDGCVPVTMNLAGLKESVGAGCKVEGDIYEPEVQETYLVNLFHMMDDEPYWLTQQLEGREFALKFVWSNIAVKWEGYFK